MNAPDEREWIARVRAGDAAAFEALVRTYAEPLVAFARSLGCSRELAEDLVQDVFSRVWERRAKWAPTTSVRSYLYQAVRNAAHNTWRHARVRRRHAQATQRAAAADPLSFATNPPPDDPELDIDAALKAAMATLTERQAAAVRLRYEHGLRHPEIAQALGVSVSAIEQLLARALRALRASAARAIGPTPPKDSEPEPDQPKPEPDPPHLWSSAIQVS
jgi:RNA polymerase sigma-70 factor, ECF subfamily